MTTAEKYGAVPEKVHVPESSFPEEDNEDTVGAAAAICAAPETRVMDFFTGGAGICPAAGFTMGGRSAFSLSAAGLSLFGSGGGFFSPPVAGSSVNSKRFSGANEPLGRSPFSGTAAPSGPASDRVTSDFT
ncbi:hypothetical protein AB0I81_58575 [Nonomuraea sp. NPDC050404]|uniref:hypothetical protein n=1 Tax=Nonomuraea sp. NPDC050404 TaxID=3155783 RepID=UPI00340B1286